MEFIAEIFPDHSFLLHSRALSAIACNLCSELHSGFIYLRSQCAMNIGPNFSREGALIWCEQAEVRCDVKSIEEA